MLLCCWFLHLGPRGVLTGSNETLMSALLLLAASIFLCRHNNVHVDVAQHEKTGHMEALRGGAGAVKVVGGADYQERWC